MIKILGDETFDSLSEDALSPDYTFKILLVGNSGTGKSALLVRFTDDVFEGEGTQEVTVGVDFKIKLLEYTANDNKQKKQLIKLNLWDTAGQERFRTLTSSYYRGAHGIILMYDITNKESFENLDSWFKELKTYAPEPPAEWIVMIVGNKIDKDSERVVSREAGMEYSRREGALFLECSSKSNVNVQKAFSEMVLKILDNIDLVVHSQNSSGKKGITVTATNHSNSVFDYCNC